MEVLDSFVFNSDGFIVWFEMGDVLYEEFFVFVVVNEGVVIFLLEGLDVGGVFF